jgi:nicotinate-nucleotide--dimethylbenzimidazole phosphoribosyltransferase
MVSPIHDSIKSHVGLLQRRHGPAGQWSVLAERICHTQQSCQPMVTPSELVLFAADHGVVEADQRKSALSCSDEAMLEMMAMGQTIPTVFAKHYGMEYRIVDVGSIAKPSFQHPFLSDRRIAPGTRNLAVEPAMTLHEFRDALAIGVDEARMTHLRASKMVLVGELGIGSEVSACCIARLLADISMDRLLRTPAGASENQLQSKRAAVEIASDRVLERCGRTIDEAGIAAVCGLEIAAIAGFFVQAAKQNQTILLDGFIATAAALIAQQFYPEVSHRMIASSLSDEPAHADMLSQLGLTPMLPWNKNTGKAMGALALYPLVTAAVAWLTQMASLDELKL